MKITYEIIQRKDFNDNHRKIFADMLALQRRFILLRHVESYYDVLRRGRLVGGAWCLL